MLCLVAQSCPTLCDSMAPLSMGILQARILDWVAMPSFRGSFQPRDWIQVSCITGGFFYHLSHQGSPINAITCAVSLFLCGVNSMWHNDGPRGATQLTETTNEDKLGFWQVMVKVLGCPIDNVLYRSFLLVLHLPLPPASWRWTSLSFCQLSF